MTSVRKLFSLNNFGPGLLPGERINGLYGEVTHTVHLHRNGADDARYFRLRYPAHDYYNLMLPNVVR